MKKQIVAYRVTKKGGNVVIQPLGRTDRGTRYVLPDKDSTEHFVFAAGDKSGLEAHITEQLVANA